GRPHQHLPELARKVPASRDQAAPGLQPFAGLIGGRRHRRPPGLARDGSVSISVKSLLTGGLAVFCGTWHSVQKKRRGEIEARNWPSRSMKCVIETIGACDSAVRARAWHDRHLLPLRSIW